MSREQVVVLSGATCGKTHDIVGSLTIGRSPENKLILNDAAVSRRHAIVEQTRSGTIIRDLGSGNGTYVGDERILERRLDSGDVISIGPLRLRYEKVGAKTERPGVAGAGVRFQSGGPGTSPGGASGLDATASLQYSFFQPAPEGLSVEQARKAQRCLAAVYEANQIISSERDLGRLFERVMDQLFSLVPAHNGVILLKEERFEGHPSCNDLVTEYVKSGMPDGKVTISTTIVNRALERREAVITSNALDDSRFDNGHAAAASIIAQNIASAMCAPMVHQGETVGVLYLDTRGTTNAFKQDDLELLAALAGPAAIAIKNAQYVAKIERSYRDTLTAIANAVELRDHYTVGHTWRVTSFAAEIARELGWKDEDLKLCEMGGVLHDVGKIAVDDTILRKASKLDEEEYAKMKVHPERGARLMRDIEMLVPLIPFSLYHHERYDGKGYPYGLAGDSIPIEGRIIAVADTFDAMTSNRPYRKGLAPDIALAELEKGKGSQFDPGCVDAFVRAYNKGSIQRVMQDFFKDEKSVACPFCSTFVKVPEDGEVGAVFQCSVCYRWLKLLMSNEAFFGELVSGQERGFSA